MVRKLNRELRFNCFFIENSKTITHWHSHTQIIYISRGSCQVYINGSLFLCEQGDLVIAPHDSLHSIVPAYDSAYYAIVIGDTLFDAIMSDTHFKRYCCRYCLESPMNPYTLVNHFHSMGVTLM